MDARTMALRAHEGQMSQQLMNPVHLPPEAKNQVACHTPCSGARRPEDVPSKEEWFRYHVIKRRDTF